jgi:hypothetical protein
MKTFSVLLVLGLLPFSVVSLAETETGKVATPLLRPHDPKVSVNFELVRKEERCEVVVKITNRSQKEISVQHPGNRFALAFLVMNEHGNIIPPVGFAKVSAVRYEDIVLKPGQTFEHAARGSGGDKYLFQFLTNTALFGYELEFGKTYRVVAIYRPDGEHGEGICSKEKIIDFEAHLHEVRSDCFH